MHHIAPSTPRYSAMAMAVAVAASLFAMSAHALDSPLAADAYITTASPATNFGAQATLNVGNGALALVGFDLSTLPPGTTAAKLVKATLVLYVNRVGIAGAVEVQVVNSGWGEAAVTNNTAPSLSGPGTGPSVAVMSAGQYVSLDVTNQVKAWLNGAPNYGLAITPALSAPLTAIFLDAKENTATGHTARLDLTLADQGPAGPSGATGATGPAGTGGGVAGPTGPTGAAGPMGPAGATGAAGAASTVPGPAGPLGATGSAGAQGPAGPAGAQGPQGPQGMQGFIGAQGLPGPTGAASTVPGPPGPAGPQGLQGPAGPQGEPGAPGPTGSFGTTGQGFIKVLGTGPISNPFADVIPGLSTTISVPDSSFVFISAEGSFSFSSTARFEGLVTVDLVINRTTTVATRTFRTFPAGGGSATSIQMTWALTFVGTLAPGEHRIEVRATAPYAGGGAFAVFGSDSTSTPSTLTAVILKQ